MKINLKVNPQFFYDEKGKKTGVMLKFKEFETLIEQLEDLNDALTVYKRTSGKKIAGSPAEDVWKRLLEK